MAVAVLRKNTGGDDPRSALREAIRAADEARDMIEQHQGAVQRARTLVADAEQRMSAAGEALEAVREEQAQTIAEAAQAGTIPAKSAALRTARLALADAEDEIGAVRLALERLKAEGQDLGASISQTEDAVMVAIAGVMEPVAEQILERIRRTRGELLALQGVF